MRTLILALIPGLLLACNNDVATTATPDESSSGGDSTGTSDPTSPTDPTSPGTDPTTGSSATSATSGMTTTSAGTDPMTTTTPDPTTGATTGSTDTATSEPGTTGDTTDTTDTTGGGGLCGADGVVVDATLEHVGEDPGCDTLEFNGSNYDLAPGPVYALDGCACGANCIVPDPWTFTLDVPQEWLPKALPACPRIVVERQMSKGGCELVGVAVWDTQEPEGAPAVYHAGSLQGPIAAAIDLISIETVTVEECDCDDCCNVPTRFDLTFSALKSMLTLSEGQEGLLGDEGLGYEVINFQSHVSGVCDESPAIDWVARRVGAP